MNIEELTLKQIREIEQLVNGTITPQSTSTTHPMVGKYCIARCYSAGVHAGTVESVDGENVVLSYSTRLWSWKAKNGVALSGVAQNGITDKSKLDTVNPQIYLTGVCELIPCSMSAVESINGKKS